MDIAPWKSNFAILFFNSDVLFNAHTLLEPVTFTLAIELWRQKANKPKNFLFSFHRTFIRFSFDTAISLAIISWLIECGAFVHTLQKMKFVIIIIKTRTDTRWNAHVSQLHVCAQYVHGRCNLSLERWIWVFFDWHCVQRWRFSEVKIMRVHSNSNYVHCFTRNVWPFFSSLISAKKKLKCNTVRAILMGIVNLARNEKRERCITERRLHVHLAHWKTMINASGIHENLRFDTVRCDMNCAIYMY